MGPQEVLRGSSGPHIGGHIGGAFVGCVVFVHCVSAIRHIWDSRIDCMPTENGVPQGASSGPLYSIAYGSLSEYTYARVCYSRYIYIHLYLLQYSCTGRAGGDLDILYLIMVS